MGFRLIVTVGPSILSRIDKLKDIHAAGPCIFRLNGAHCSPEQLKIFTGVIRAVIPGADVMIDLPGNKIRTAPLPYPIKFEKSEVITLTGDNFNYKNFPALLKEGDEILANDSTQHFTVCEARGDSVSLRARNSGELISGKGMHVRGICAKLPFLFQDDINLINAAAEAKLQYVSLSYVRNAGDIKTAKQLLSERNYSPEIIAKIETASAVEHLDEILSELNIFNIDRGDLSTDIGIINLAAAQDKIVNAALAAGKDIFLATQFLKNMELNPIPLIPEIVDLCSSVKKGISGIQLSEETAVGRYPLECIRLVWEIHKSAGVPR
jgi:pyruvate kinase